MNKKESRIRNDEAMIRKESRIERLAAVLDRRLPLYRLETPEAERRVILAVAADTLPDPWPPDPGEAAAARAIKRLIACPEAP